MDKVFRPGARFEQMTGDGFRGERGGIWQALGWSRQQIEPGRSVMNWEATTDHAFPTVNDAWIVHGGMVTALLDTAMGQATWSLLDLDQVFLTADLRTEFYRPALPGYLRAQGWVVHKTRKVTFAAAELFDEKDKLLASCRATNITLELQTRRESDYHAS